MKNIELLLQVPYMQENNRTGYSDIKENQSILDYFYCYYAENKSSNFVKECVFKIKKDNSLIGAFKVYYFCTENKQNIKFFLDFIIAHNLSIYPHIKNQIEKINCNIISHFFLIDVFNFTIQLDNKELAEIECEIMNNMVDLVKGFNYLTKMPETNALSSNICGSAAFKVSKTDGIDTTIVLS